MIVKVRTGAQAATVAERTGGVVLAANVRSDGTTGAALFVDVGCDFEAVRAGVETVTVMFELFDGTAATFDTDGPGVMVPNGWTMTAAKFEVEWPEDPSRVHSHFGARRFAYNWALGQVKADIDAKTVDPDHVGVRWDFQSLRNAWNRSKHEVAPWWAENSKEAYCTGIADLATALGNWNSSKRGTRQGRNVGFPKFKSARRDRKRVRFTTGAMRLEPDRRTIVVPTVGALRSKENTRRVQRHLAAGRARIFNMTLSEQWGRLFVSINYAQRTPNTAHRPTRDGVRCGVDLGLRDLATVATSDGDVIVYPNPAPLRATLAERRRTGKQMSRRIPGSRGHEQAKAKLVRLDRRAVNIRRQAAHQLTTELARTYSEIVIEDLDLAAMKQSMGRRAFRRSVSDAALGTVRPMLEYKCRRHGTTLTIASRWFPSSQIHHGCGCRLHAEHRLDKMLTCTETGERVDRDINAAHNLRDWPQSQSSGPVRSAAPSGSPEEPRASRVGGPDHVPNTSPGEADVRRTTPGSTPTAEEARTKTLQREATR